MYINDDTTLYLLIDLLYINFISTLYLLYIYVYIYTCILYVVMCITYVKAVGHQDMRNRELNNGRFAMVAILGIVAAELVTGKDAVQQLGFWRGLTAACGGPEGKNCGEWNKKHGGMLKTDVSRIF